MKRVFLTGASSGIGLAIAQSLRARGDEVWGTSRDGSRLAQVDGLHPITLDLADRSSIAPAFQAALAQAGHFDVVINNAGAGHFDPAETLSQAALERLFQVLVFGQIELMQLALRAMQQHGHGLVVNVSSLASRLPVPFMSAYNAAKAALASFTMSIQLELPRSAIRVVDLQPADINTGFNDAITRTAAEPRYRDRLAKAWAATDRNMKAAPRPEVVARHVLRLIDSSNPPPRITVGDTFQTRIAPVIIALIPQRLRIWGLKRYYGI